EFDVGAVLVGEVPIPGVTELVVAPGPLLFAGRDVMVSDVDEAGFAFVVVAAAKIFHRADRHVAGWNRNVGVPSQIVRGIVPGRHELAGPLFLWDSLLGALAIIDAIVVAVTQRKAAHRALGVVSDVAHIGRKE